MSTRLEVRKLASGMVRFNRVMDASYLGAGVESVETVCTLSPEEFEMVRSVGTASTEMGSVA